jgi:hypothetical protein
VEDGRVLGDDQALGGRVEVVEVDVLRPAIAGGQLGARHREAGAQLGQRQHAAQAALDVVERADVVGADAPEARGRVLPALGALEVDQPARGEAGLQAGARLLVDQVPAGLGDRRVAAQQVGGGHHAAPRSEPMPSEPS